MYRTLCVLALLTLQAGLAHSFSWEIVAARNNRLEFYNEEKLTFSVTSSSFNDHHVQWITYDPFHNRVLIINSNTKSLLSFDIATGEIQTLIIAFKPSFVFITSYYTYDPATGLFFAKFGSDNKIYSYLVKPGTNHEVAGNLVINLKSSFYEMAVDSCGGYIYLSPTFRGIIERVRLNDTKREELNILVDSSDGTKTGLNIDSQAQKMYWIEYFSEYPGGLRTIVNADLNGKNRRTLHNVTVLYPSQLTVSKDFIYWATSYEQFFWKMPRNQSLGTDVKPEKFAFNDTSTNSGQKFNYIAANYAIEEQPQGIPLCKALKRLLPNYSETNDSDSLNVSTDGSLLRVNETKVSGESRVSGDTCNVSVYQYYCLQGHCSTSADGQPKCRCNAGYSGKRCEVNACQSYCLNAGTCSLSEENNPVCQCTGGYQGERCDVPDFLIKCTQTVSLLKDILNADLTTVTEGKGVKSTCALTVV